MTYDCFPFFNELDLLEIRLNVLKDVVDKFVIVEAPWTRTGNPKPLYFNDNRQRFAAFQDKIIHVIASSPPVKKDAPLRENAWRRENFQRNEIVRGLVDAKPDDLILLSDLDEIPSPEAVLVAKGLSGVSRFRQKFYNFFLNYRNCSVPFWPIGTQACSYGTFLDPATYEGQRCDQFLLEDVNPCPSMTRLRMIGASRTVRNGGWHFSYCGGIEAVRTKLAAFAHTECNSAKAADPKFISEALESGKDPVCRNYRFFAEPIDDAGFPRYIMENAAQYKHLVLPVDNAYLRRTRLPRTLALTKGAAYRLMVKCIPEWLVPVALRVRSWIFERRQASA